MPDLRHSEPIHSVFIRDLFLNLLSDNVELFYYMRFTIITLIQFNFIYIDFINRAQLTHEGNVASDIKKLGKPVGKLD